MPRLENRLYSVASVPALIKRALGATMMTGNEEPNDPVTAGRGGGCGADRVTPKTDPKQPLQNPKQLETILKHIKGNPKQTQNNPK